MISKNIIKAITALIKPACGAVYFGISPVKYPKICCDLRELTNDGCKHGFRLVLDFYSNDGDYPAGLDMADAVRGLLTSQHGDVDGGYMTVYPDGSRYITPEKDNEKIVHITEGYDVYFYDKEE